MVKALSIEGKKFGKLTVVKRSGSIRKKAAWLCACECGAESTVVSSNLTSGKTTSCGCFSRKKASDNAIKRNTVHGHNKSGQDNKSPTWKSWAAMLQRCKNKNHKSYKNYGGRGVSVFPLWEEYANFLSDIGERPSGKTLDRIDVEGNYEPGNCRWATPSEQQKNKRCSIK